MPDTNPPFWRRALANWRERHQLPLNFWLHMVGIPLALAGLLYLVIDVWWGLGGLTIGYLLQYIGHRAEGNDLGEWAGVKKLLGLPYVAIAPRWQTPMNQEATKEGTA
jgi:2-hydroxy-palmitic acid dioxygenase Mpo1-like protein